MTTKRTAVRLLGAAMMTLAIAPWVGGGAASAAPPSEDCPAGTTAVAKYNVSGGAYVAEFGGDVVTVSGTTAGGTFTSAVPISDVFVKGGTDGKVDHYDPSVTAGSFDNTTLINDGGQTPAISHVTFCTGSTSTTSSAPATTTTTATTSAPATTTVTTSAPATTTTTGAATTSAAAAAAATTATSGASVLPTKVEASESAAEETEVAVAVEGTKTGGGQLAATGSGLSVGMALAVSLGLLLGGAALLAVPGRLAVERGRHRRRH